MSLAFAAASGGSQAAPWVRAALTPLPRGTLPLSATLASMTRERRSSSSHRRDATLALPAGLEIVEHRPELILATDGCVMFRFWRTTATIDSFLRCEAALDRFSAEHRRFATLSVMGPHVGTPSAEVREAAGRLMARFAAKASANALVIEGTGSKQTGVRLAVTTVQLLTPSVTPPVVFALLQEAVDWLATQVPEASAPQLLRDVAALRSL